MVHAQCPLIVTGMHRSGTSLVARLLQGAGVYLGSELLGPGKGNPYGHFEDLDFLNFQSNLLDRAHCRLFVQERFDEPPWTEGEKRAAEELIQARAAHELWGWKDPRTTLFLGAWETLLPQAHFIFVYRSPIEVTLSLLRRGTESDVVASPMLALRSWQVYNQRVLEIFHQRPRQHFLCNVHSIVVDVEGFFHALSEKVGRPLGGNDLRELVDARALRGLDDPRGISALVEEAWPEIAETYRQLEESADLPGGLLDRRQPMRPDQAGLSAVFAVSRALREDGVPEAALQQALLSLLTVWLAGSEVADRETKLLEILGTLEGRIADLELHTENLETRVRELTLHANNLEQEVSARDRRIEELEKSRVKTGLEAS